MGFHHVGQAGLELLTSGDLPASVSQSVRITGVSHRAWQTEILGSSLPTAQTGRSLTEWIELADGGVKNTWTACYED